MIKIVHEPADFADAPAESCCLCGKETRWWCEEKDVPVCPDCAARHNTSMLPLKADWIRFENSKEDDRDEGSC
jgi:hypothetical protein